jgi:hypothetical protein
MKRFWNSRPAKLLMVLSALAIAAGCASAPSPRLDESQLSAAGFKVLVATTNVQRDWVQSLAPGQIRPMQRTGKKYFIYPDASRNQIYVGGPAEYEAYRRLNPEYKPVVQESGMAGYVRQSDAMWEASARDLSDPFFGASWADLGW